MRDALYNDEIINCNDLLNTKIQTYKISSVFYKCQYCGDDKCIFVNNPLHYHFRHSKNDTKNKKCPLRCSRKYDSNFFTNLLFSNNNENIKKIIDENYIYNGFNIYLYDFILDNKPLNDKNDLPNIYILNGKIRRIEFSFDYKNEKNNLVRLSNKNDIKLLFNNSDLIFIYLFSDYFVKIINKNYNFEFIHIDKIKEITGLNIKSSYLNDFSKIIDDYFKKKQQIKIQEEEQQKRKEEEERQRRKAEQEEERQRRKKEEEAKREAEEKETQRKIDEEMSREDREERQRQRQKEEEEVKKEEERKRKQIAEAHKKIAIMSIEQTKRRLKYCCNYESDYYKSLLNDLSKYEREIS